MEEVLKFITTEPPKRTEAFLFLWRVLMAILITNYRMSELGYHFTNQEIKLNTVIDFLFSDTFFHVVKFYIMYHFLFFTALKIWFFILDELIFYNKWMFSQEQLLSLLVGANYLKEYNRELYFTNEKKYETFEFIYQDAAKKRFKCMSGVYSMVCTAIATEWWLWNLGDELASSWIKIALMILTFLAILFLSLLYYVLISFIDSYELFEKIKQKGYYKDIFNKIVIYH